MNEILKQQKSLFSIAQKIHNRRVELRFAPEVQAKNSNVPEEKLKYELTIKDDDSLVMSNTRMLLFANYLNEDILELLDYIYGVPKDSVPQAFKAQIVLKFKEVKPYENNKKRPKRMEITVDTDFKVDEIKDSNINQIIAKINSAFPQSYSHYAGVNRYQYYDSYHQTKKEVSARNLADARNFFKKFFSLGTTPYNDDNIKVFSFTDLSGRKDDTLKVLGTKQKRYRNVVTGIVKLHCAVLVLGSYCQEYIVSRNL